MDHSQICEPTRPEKLLELHGRPASGRHALQLKERLRYDVEPETGKRTQKNLSAREQYAPLIVKPSGRAEIRYTSLCDPPQP
ncbi:hypothetical protein CUJ84_pRLN2000143 (plasmid) [Rhizobium leguminosarum]|uniref:Uncharacterized protein n=1 Tax=Rhizobium leguminosarum TaxID=384 RepID=A0A2K9ZEP4_RHILE|nr:hypothetical protein CUJ84_pRLN2000143 [Rhizobium leguminosarum]